MNHRLNQDNALWPRYLCGEMNNLWCTCTGLMIFKDTTHVVLYKLLLIGSDQGRIYYLDITCIYLPGLMLLVKY